MMTSVLLMSCALTLGQTKDRADWTLTPQLTPGLELVYRGIFLDESLIPNAQHQRQYRLDAHMLVLDASIKDWHVAFMTGLSLQDGRPQTGKQSDGPTSVRLEQAKIDWQGRVRTLDGKFLEIPLHGPATIECGFVAPIPLQKIGLKSSWEVNAPGMPTQHWKVIAVEPSAGVLCLKIVGTQQSDDWERGRADRTAWRRRDTVWLHPQYHVAQKIERVIEQRAPARETPTHRNIVRCELDSHLKYPGRSFEERRDEIVKASKFHAEAQTLLRQPTLNRAHADILIQRVAFHLDHAQAQQATPYRKAILHVKSVLEKAKHGDVPAPVVRDEPTVSLTRKCDVGTRVPDFAASSFTEDQATGFKSARGKPIVVVFYNPATRLGREILAYTKELSQKQPDRVAIMAMAVTNDAELVRKQHKDLRLTFPILDGNGLRLTFGAVETPHFVVVDSDGIVRLAQTGWGYHTPTDIANILQRCQK